MTNFTISPEGTATSSHRGTDDPDFQRCDGCDSGLIVEDPSKPWHCPFCRYVNAPRPKPCSVCGGDVSKPAWDRWCPEFGAWVPMKALTLHQPWASLVADGRKTIETRSWETPRNIIGERIAIHAGKRAHVPSCEKWFPVETVPLGAIICTARIDDFAHVEPGEAPLQTLAWWYGRRESDRVPIDEFGDFTHGRHLWKLAEVKELTPMVHVRGRQRLCDWLPGQPGWNVKKGGDSNAQTDNP